MTSLPPTLYNGIAKGNRPAVVLGTTNKTSPSSRKLPGDIFHHRIRLTTAITRLATAINAMNNS